VSQRLDVIDVLAFFEAAVWFFSQLFSRANGFLILATKDG
jgi:hypothetical protein